MQLDLKSSDLEWMYFFQNELFADNYTSKKHKKNMQKYFNLENNMKFQKFP